ncbi:MAG TPA: HEAT repeat domain-containing protein [Gaiellales bacterium]|nr:HEAT repeat domain-containing protein [Gaiellales bacterium]
MIVAVELLAAAQLAVISMLALVLTGRRVAIARAGRRRQLLLDRYRDAVVEFVGLDDDTPPEPLTRLRTSEQRSAVGELLAEYAGTVRGESRARVAAFVADQGYAAAAARDLHAVRAWRRGTATKTLGDFGVVSSVDELADALRLDRSRQVRVSAARAIGRVGDARGTVDLIGACAAGSVPAGIVAQALLDIGEPALPWLLGALASDERRVRVVACRVVGLMGVGADADVVAALQAAATTDPVVDVRVAACEALGRVGGLDAALSLAAATADAEPSVRRMACDAAARLAAPETAAVVERALDDGHAEVRRAAARAAVVLGVGESSGSPFVAEAEAELAWGWR